MVSIEVYDHPALLLHNLSENIRKVDTKCFTYYGTQHDKHFLLSLKLPHIFVIIFTFENIRLYCYNLFEGILRREDDHVLPTARRQ